MEAIMNRPPIAGRLYPDHKFRELLDAIGTDKEIAALIQRHGYEAPPLASIRGWRSRNSIPSRWVPLLMAEVIRVGWLDGPENLIKEPF